MLPACRAMRFPGITPSGVTAGSGVPASMTPAYCCELRRIGDLNPGGWLHPTALAARVAAVRIGSGWTNAPDRSFVHDAARR